jgi:hypothetical protein
MKAHVLSALALLLVLSGALRADPPGVVERIEKGGGEVRRGGAGGRADMVVLGRGATDADLAGLCELRELEILALSGSRVTDDGLRTIAALRSVRGLSLESDDITDAGLRHLEALNTLEVLLLARCTKVTDAGVARLKKALPRCDIHR